MLGCDLFYDLDLVHEYQQEMDELAERLRRRSHSSETPTPLASRWVNQAIRRRETLLPPRKNKHSSERLTMLLHLRGRRTLINSTQLSN